MSTGKNVRNRVIGTKFINWRQAKWLQNEDLKDLDSDGMQRLKASLINNDFVMPFTIWEESEADRWILDGHHREKALKELEAEGVEIPSELPAVLISCETKTEAAKLVLIYSSIYAKITNAGLNNFMELHELNLEDFKLEIDLPEFSMPRFEQQFNSFTDSEEEEETEEEQKVTEFSEIIVQTGDIFRIGAHLIYCGDGLKSEVWHKLFEIAGDVAKNKARMVYTDPPYNLTADTIGNLGATQHENFSQAAGEMSDAEFVAFLRKMMILACEVSANGALHYIWMDFRHIWHMTEAGKMPYLSVEPKQLCVWNKDLAGMGSFYKSKHEFCFIYKNGKEKHVSNVNLKDRIRYNVWEYPSGNSMSNVDKEELKAHPTPKNVAMSRDAILDVTNEKDLIVDFFVGSGTTIIAAEQANRVCVGSEIEPKYVQHALFRYKKECDKIGKECVFEHVNGDLSLSKLLATVS